MIFEKIKKFFHASKPELLFIVILLTFAFVYDYPALLSKRPQSTHRWRQSDCASLTLNYYQTGMHFFQPQTHNLTSDNNTTGYTAPSEIPLQYYFIACLYKVFGYHDYIYRSLNTLIFLLGIFFLFKLNFLLIKDFFWSAAFTLLFFTSPVLVFYGNNFITDSSAFAFALIALYFFISYYHNKKTSFFILAMVFFFLAGASKITGLMGLLAISLIFILELYGKFDFRKGDKIFTKPELNGVYILAVFIVIGLWIYYAKNYNLAHSTGYFSTRTFPFWDLTSEEIQKVLENIKGLWLNQYFQVYTLYFFALTFLITFIFIRKADRFLMAMQILLFIGTAIYAILWFWTFKDHDYYTINLYILLVITLLNFGHLIHTYFPKLFSSLVMRFLFFCFLLFNMNHARTQMHDRYFTWWSEYPEYKDYHTITPYLRSIGIAPLDTVICLPDISHFTLYLMNQRGWTECLGNNTDSAAITSSISKGAHFLIINGEDVLKRPYLQSFITNPIGEYNQVKIFKLDKH